MLNHLWYMRTDVNLRMDRLIVWLQWWTTHPSRRSVLEKNAESSLIYENTCEPSYALPNCLATMVNHTSLTQTLLSHYQLEQAIQLLVAGVQLMYAFHTHTKGCQHAARIANCMCMCHLVGYEWGSLRGHPDQCTNSTLWLCCVKVS
jgi:hypothetical protein